MDQKNLHTAFLENQFGPISIGILKQENKLRMVNLYDQHSVSRTVAIVQFHETDKEVVRSAHQKILNGDPLGNTLSISDIDFDKIQLQKFMVRLPDWLIEDFGSAETETLAIHSQINIRDASEEEAFLYANIIEIIPPDILYLFQLNGELKNADTKELADMLDFASIST